MSNAAQLQQALVHWNGGNLDAYLGFYSPGIRLHGYSPEPMDLAAVRGFYGMIWDNLRGENQPSPRMQIGEIFEQGDRLAFRGTMSGHHLGPFLGFAPTGRPYTIGVVTTMRFENGKVAERWSCADMLGLLLQSGAMALPG